MTSTTLDPLRLLELEDAMVRTIERMSSDLRDLFRFVVSFDRAEGWARDGATSMAAWLAYRFSISLSLARDWVRAAHALEGLPAIAEAFAEGLICWEKVRRLVLIATPETDRRLARFGVEWNVAQIELYVRHQRRIAREEADDAQSKRGLWTRWNREDGMLHLWGRLHGAEGAVVQKALDRVSEQLFPLEARAAMFRDESQRYADAVVELASSHLVADPDTDRATVMCNVDASVLASKEGNGSLEYGIAIGSETVRRIACDARTQTIFWGPDGRPVGIGRTSRTVPPWLSRLLLQRDQGCRWPGCGRTRGVQAHHLVHWADGGRTDAENLLLLCRYHHRLIHEGGWGLEFAPSGRLRVLRPDGSVMRRSADPGRATLAPTGTDCRGP